MIGHLHIHFHLAVGRGLVLDLAAAADNSDTLRKDVYKRQGYQRYLSLK